MILAEAKGRTDVESFIITRLSTHHLCEKNSLCQKQFTSEVFQLATEAKLAAVSCLQTVVLATVWADTVAHACISIL